MTTESSSNEDIYQEAGLISLGEAISTSSVDPDQENNAKLNDGKVCIGMQNVEKCGEAIFLEMHMTAFLQDNFLKSNPQLFTAEESLLNLAATEMAGGIFFCCVLKVGMGDSFYVARFFEHGAFVGFFETFHPMLKEFLSCAEILPCRSFTAEDVVAARERNIQVHAQRFKKGHPKYQAFKRNIYSNKSGFNKSIESILEQTEIPSKLACPVVLALIFKNQQRNGKNTDRSEEANQRYIVCHPENAQEEWENKLMWYRSNPGKVTSPYEIWTKAPVTLSLEEQFKLITSIPNFHKWYWGKLVRGLKFEQKLSTCCRYFPGSPRNRIIQAYVHRENCDDIIKSVLLCLLDKQAVVVYPAKKRKYGEVHSNTAKHRKHASMATDKISEVIDCENNGMGEDVIPIIGETANQDVVGEGNNDEEEVNVQDVTTQQKLLSQDEKLRKNIQIRYHNIFRGVNEFVPAIENDMCNCGAGWKSNRLPDGIVKSSGKTMLYYDRGVVEAQVFHRLCVDQSCVLVWDGADESIYRSSKSTCAGYEVGWDFVQRVMDSKLTFQGFVNSHNAVYARNSCVFPFMSRQTFIEWFFGWASYMKVDFRQICEACGENPEVLACDGTKKGIGFKNAFVKPIETAETTEITTQQSRRLNRCFLNNPSQESSHRIASARKIVKNTCRNIINDHTYQIPEDNVTSHSSVLPQQATSSFNVMVGTSIDENTRIS